MHEITHPPEMQACPDMHAVPHAPQLARSLVTSRHDPEQLVSPAPHDVTHAAPEHTWPAGHALPHAPQLA